MSSLIQQRRAMYEQKMQDDYPGCEFGVGLANNISLFPWAQTPYVEVPSNCASLTMHYDDSPYIYPTSSTGYDDTKSLTGYQLQNNNRQKPWTFTAGTYKYVRMSINIDCIDDCYIYDNTNNQYLWKGKNIV